MYDQNFYNRCLKKYNIFANEVIPILINEFKPKSVIDIGCGAGMYIKSFYDRGIDVVGYEGNNNAITYGLLPEKVIIHDFCEKLKLKKSFDLCLCIEVAEHIPKEKANELVQTLCGASNNILFTAGKPGQSGSGHINCQNEEYWIQKFAENNFMFDKKVRDKLKLQIQKLPSLIKTSNFFYKNLMIFKG